MSDKGLPPTIDFVAKLAELRASKGQAQPPGVTPPPPVPQPPGGGEWKQSDLLPDLGGKGLTDADKELDAFIEGITFPMAYNKWIAKMVAIQTKDDGNEISCPIPGHADPPRGNGHGGYNAWFKS